MVFEGCRKWPAEHRGNGLSDAPWDCDADPDRPPPAPQTEVEAPYRLSQLGTPGFPGPSSGHWLPLLAPQLIGSPMAVPNRSRLGTGSGFRWFLSIHESIRRPDFRRN